MNIVLNDVEKGIVCGILSRFILRGRREQTELVLLTNDCAAEIFNLIENNQNALLLSRSDEA